MPGPFADSAARLALPSALALAGLVCLGPLTAGADRDGDGLRDAFERKHGVTDPNKRDSDRDGVIDSAEDSDGDRLSNLGEQRFKTDPGRRDSDGDGIDDGREDHDRDGRSNAREQDQRRLPGQLRPSLERAKRDFPPRRFKCQSGVWESAIRPCAFGDTGSRTKVALFGDSHAAQWVPALDRAGKQAGWKIIQLTRTACASVVSINRGNYLRDGGRSCDAWRARASKWLRRHPPDVIIISNMARYRLVTRNGSLIPTSRREQAWRQGLATTLASLPRRSRVVVLADTPYMGRDSVVCLRAHRNDMSACVTPRGATRSVAHDRAERAAANGAGERFENLAGKICPYDPCPVVVGKKLIWRNLTHMSATYSRQLAPAMRKLVQRNLPADAGSTP